ncbi:unnamed protein product [Ophioblennius macclurei]
MSSGGLSQDINQEEMYFSDLFLYNPPGEEFPAGEEDDDPGVLLQTDSQPPLVVVDSHAAYNSTSPQPPSSQDVTSHGHTAETLSGAVFDSRGLTSRASNIPAPSPRIEITPSGDSLSSQIVELSPGPKALGAYRDCVSPASSNSSTGWPVETYSPVASPCVSPSNGAGCNAGLSALDLCPGLQAIHTSSAHSSPGASPRNSITDETYLQPQGQRAASPLPHQRSRSASPHGKRSYDQAQPCHGATPVKQRSRSPSPIPSPHEHQGSYYLHQYQAQTAFQPQAQAAASGLEEMLNNMSSDLTRIVPSAVVRGAHVQAQTQDCVYREGNVWIAEQERMGRAGVEVKPETFYMIPAVRPVPNPIIHSTQSSFSGLAVAPLPSLEWPLPSQSGQYELIIQQQPRSHHRAHYETEGSRGAVKTPNGGHPEIQLCGYQGTAPLGLHVFIGTADERLLKPHAFYQVHRITGKTVTTHSIERMINGTKVLEIPLEPKNHMGVVIDCVGILKLRNADIELRNGETDIGRKNTRVRLVFRVHIPQPGGQIVSLQAASNPIECSQRSAQELPAVERQNLDRCSVLGGQQMVLTGQNFTSDSKVVFSEKTQHGQQIWEVEATVDRDKTQSNMLFIEVPPYKDRTIHHPVKVNFYVINGKKKRSQPQHFIYTPVIAIKTEPLDDYHLNSYGFSDNRALPDMSMKSLYPYHNQDNYHLTAVDPRAHAIGPDPLDEQLVYYQSRAGTLINSPLLYHSPNQRYNNCSPSHLGGSPIGSHASSYGPCVTANMPLAELGKAPEVENSFDTYVVSRHLGYVPPVLPLGKSPPSRCVQGQTQGKTEVDQSRQPLNQISPARELHEKHSPERITVKQENLSYAYLEDVNDIIRRDMKSYNGE